MKKILLGFVLLSSFTAVVYSQDTPRLSVYLNPLYQNWSIKNGSDFSELTNLLSANFSAFSNSSFRLNTRYSSVSGDLNSLKGFSDTQLSFRYNLKKYNLLFDAGVNIPTGKTRLSSDDYATSKVISQGVFGLQTPNFGQGTNFFAGATYLYPVSDAFVLAGGLSYQLRSEYQPLDSPSVKYKPSNEITATAGFDAKLSQTAALTGDFTGIFYGSDKADGKEVFKPGRRLMINIMYKKYFRFNALSLLLSYRNAGTDKLQNILVPSENEKVNPDMVYFNAGFLQHLSSVFNFNYSLFLISYQETILFYSGYMFFGAAFSPEIKMSPSFSIPLRIKYMQGTAKNKPDLRNYDLGIAIVLSM